MDHSSGGWLVTHIRVWVTHSVRRDLIDGAFIAGLEGGPIGGSSLRRPWSEDHPPHQQITPPPLIGIVTSINIDVLNMRNKTLVIGLEWKKNIKTGFGIDLEMNRKSRGVFVLVSI